MLSTPTPSKVFRVKNTKAPDLLVAPVEYTQTYQDQFINALRLYFNQLDNYTYSESIPDSGSTVDRPKQSEQQPLLVGQFYFDTTLGKPIWWKGAVWVDAAGVTV